MGFRENLKSELLYKDIRVKELAEKTGISKRTLDNYLTENSCKPLAENAVKIAAALNVSVEYLVTGTDKSIPQQNIRTPIAKIIKDLNYLSDEDLKHLGFIVSKMKKN